MPKLSRAADSPVRDVFDIICAAKADPNALATAVGTVNTQQAERIATRWRTADKEFAREAATELKDICPEFETPRNTLGSDAANALEKHRYVRLEIKVERDNIVIRNGPTMPIKMAIAIETMAKYKRTGVLYDSQNRATRDQVAFPNKHWRDTMAAFCVESRVATAVDQGRSASARRGDNRERDQCELSPSSSCASP